MNYTFGRVAAHCGLRLSYYITAALLFIVFVGLALTENYRTASPLYILLVLAVLPSLLKAIFFSNPKKEKRENDLAFPLFCQKYHYDRIMYKSMNLAYLLLFLLFAAWHISYRLVENIPPVVSALPAALAALSLLIRVLGVIGYRLYFHLFPLRAMH